MFERKRKLTSLEAKVRQEVTKDLTKKRAGKLGRREKFRGQVMKGEREIEGRIGCLVTRITRSLKHRILRSSLKRMDDEVEGRN